MLLTLLLAISTGCLPVEGDRILLRDLAAAIPAFAESDPNESIGFAPAPGSQRRFSAGELNRLAARKGIAQDLEPVCFERKLSTLTKEQVLTALRDALPKDAELELIEFSQSQIPKGALEFPRSGLARARPATPREPLIWRGRIRYTAAQTFPVWARVRAWTPRPALLAIEELQPGKPIGAGQIQQKLVDTPPFAETIPVIVEGLAPRRTIHAGEVISAAALVTPVDVIRGEMAGVEARYGAALVKFEVRAEASGRTGESIAVRNVDSGKTFRARVLRKGWVGVEGTE